MTTEKARSLAARLGGEVERTTPRSRSPGVRLSLADGRVPLLDELGGATYKSAAAVDAYATDRDDGAEIHDSAAHYEMYYDEELPEPGYIYWADTAAQF